MIKLLIALACAFAGCAGAVAEAPFALMPGSVVPGDLRGPFTGQVLDGDSGKPLAGATVVGSWAAETGLGFVGPAAATDQVTTSDSDGRYRLGPAPEIAGRLVRFTLVVYKRGWIAWRSDRRFEDDSPRRDFAQTENVVTLARFPTDGSHARHLRFIGDGAPLEPELAAEAGQAAEELAGAATPAAAEAKAPPAPSIDATALLTPDELVAVTGYQGTIAVGKLGDLPSSPSYDSVHFEAEGKPGEDYDAAIRLFHGDAATMEAQWNKLAKEYPNVEVKDEIGDKSFRSVENNSLGLVMLDRAKGVVLVFICGRSQCHDFDTMVGLVGRMRARVDKALRPPLKLAPGLNP